MNDFIEALRDVFWKYEKLYGKELLHCLLAWLVLDAIWKIYLNPATTWAAVQKNIVNPYYYIPIGIITFLWFAAVAFMVVDKFYFNPLREKELAFLKQVQKGLLKSKEETEKIRSGETPSDDDIKKYYKMYLKKYELDTADEWTTIEPMSFVDFQTEAKAKPDESGIIAKHVGWGFLIAMTSDAFSFDPSTGQSTMWRYRDYEELMDDDYHFDQETINKQLDI